MLKSLGLSYLSSLPSVPLLFVGDFNTRIGQNNLALAHFLHRSDEDFISPWFLSPRCSLDSKINNYAPHLVDLCITLNLVILNGFLSSDLPGAFTYIAPNGTSVIDYILVSPSLLPCLSEFLISSFHESDHLPICLCLSLPSSTHNSNHNTTQHTSSPPIRLKWSHSTIAALDSWCSKEDTGSLLHSLAVTNSAPTAISIYESLINSVICSLNSSNTNRKPNICSPWFDRECRLAKDLVRQLFLSVRCDPSPDTLRQYFRSRTQCKALLEAKKHSFAEHKWFQLLEAISSNNQKAFWSLVSPTFRSSHSLPAPISSVSWVSHFSTIFSHPPSVDPPPFPSINMPEWPPVDPEEVATLIVSLKSGKAPGPDNVISEILISRPSWWAAPLANLFTLINSSGQIPSTWLSSTIIPIFKKGDPSLPTNYRPISLLSVIGKLYSKFLLSKLSSWAHSNSLPGREQIGFRPNSSSCDHIFLLSYLAEKYLAHQGQKLFTAFVDLKGAFDSINRSLLWDKLSFRSIDPRLLFLLQRLHSFNSCRVRSSPLGPLSDHIPVNKGVRQGCILAPLLFNLFLADLPIFLCKKQISPPSLNGAPVPILLYADDAVLLSRTKLGLRNALAIFQDYCKANDLVINDDKTKILVFSKSWAPSVWKVGNSCFEQVRTYKYLGINFHFRLNWTAHRKLAIASSRQHLNGIARFHFTTGNQFVPAALQVFRAKIIAQLLYGIPIWITAVDNSVDQVAAVFLRRILGVPNLIRLSTLALELGIHLPSTLAWSLSFKFWLRLHFNLPSESLLNDLLRDPYRSSWFLAIEAKLDSLGIPVESLVDLCPTEALKMIKAKLWEAEFASLFANLNPICSPLFFNLPPRPGLSPYYPNLLKNAPLRRAFMLARLNIFPSSFHLGRFSQTPRAQRLCHLCMLEPDSIEHILTRCPMLVQLRKRFLGACLRHPVGLYGNLTSFLLSDSLADVTTAVAGFLLQVLSLPSSRLP